MAFTYLPNGIFDINSINWNLLDISATSFNSIPTAEGEDIGWGDYPVNGESAETYKAKVQTETAKGNNIGAKIFGAVLVYGPTVLQLLRSLNVIKSNGTVDNTEAEKTLIATNGKLDANTLAGLQSNGLTSSGSNVLGIPTSYIALGLGGLLLYQLFKSDKKKK